MVVSALLRRAVLLWMTLTAHVSEIVNVVRVHRLIGQIAPTNRPTSSMAGRRTIWTELFVVSEIFRRVGLFDLKILLFIDSMNVCENSDPTPKEGLPHDLELFFLFWLHFRHFDLNQNCLNSYRISFAELK